MQYVWKIISKIEKKNYPRHTPTLSRFSRITRLLSTPSTSLPYIAVTGDGSEFSDLRFLLSFQFQLPYSFLANRLFLILKVDPSHQYNLYLKGKLVQFASGLFRSLLLLWLIVSSSSIKNQFFDISQRLF